MSDINFTQKKTPDPEIFSITNDVYVAVYFFEGCTIPMVQAHPEKNELLKTMRSWNGLDRKRGALIYKLDAPE